jgi:glycosyltransferase involved in cell wall biosynthesis
MKVALATGRPAHAAIPARLLHRRGDQVTLYTAAYRARFHGLESAIRLRWVPQWVPIFHFVTGVQLPRRVQRADTVAFDHIVAARLQPCDLYWGSATGALAAGRAAQRMGAHFVLDRACPHVDAQQAIVRAECKRIGLRYAAEPDWFRARQLAEYAEADAILVPSRYSASTFPQPLQKKIFVAPLFGRVTPASALSTAKDASGAATPRSHQPFTFGMVGGNPARKGLLDLLQAWGRLRLPDARLLLRTDAALEKIPALREAMRGLHNVERVEYCQDMRDFYARCDAFVLPTLDDGFGMALLEAVAQDLPAITTPCCGAAELFRAGEEILLVPPHNPPALAEAMEQLYRSRELREQLRTNARLALEKIEGGGEYALYAQGMEQMLAWLEQPR